MVDSNDGVRRYQQETRALLVKRALGLLTLDDEAEMAELLDDIWRTLTKDQHEEIERWLKEARRPRPSADIHQQAAEVEAEDITVAPRSAA